MLFINCSLLLEFFEKQLCCLFDLIVMPATHDLLIETLSTTFSRSEYKPQLLAEFISLLVRQTSIKHQNIS